MKKLFFILSMLLFSLNSQAGNFVNVTFKADKNTEGFHFFKSPKMVTNLPARFTFYSNQAATFEFDDKSTVQGDYIILQFFNKTQDGMILTICDVEITPAYWKRKVQRIEIKNYNNAEGRFCKSESLGADEKVLIGL